METTAHNLDGNTRDYAIDNVPEICPICNHACQAKHIDTQELEERQVLQVIYRCPRTKCQECFIYTYSIDKAINNTFSYYIKKILSISPKKYKKEKLSDHINSISPSFIEIFNQSLLAESKGCHEIVGIGLRKALEFLVKDYCMYNNPNKKEEICKYSLAICIKEYVTDVHIKACAERAAWLGNDEAHYLRKWENKNIKDLKKLIRLTVLWIESAETTKMYMQDME